MPRAVREMFAIAILIHGLRHVTSQFTKGVAGSCSFPEFLWFVAPDTTERVWYTATKFPSNAATWESRRKILAKDGVLAIHVQYPWHCEDDVTDHGACIKNDFLYTMACMQREGHHTYRVAKRGQGFTRFLCLRFVRRNANIVQAWLSPASATNEADLCSEERLARDEWPWMAQDHTRWEPCPFVGGYDFSSFYDDRKKAICHRIWRPSRLESECMHGEGFHFTFPEKTCSFFHDKRLDSRLYCWGTWQEGSYVFVVAGEPLTQPRYVMRFPFDSDLDQLSVHLVTSPLCTLSADGIPAGNVQHVRLDLRRSEPGTCYDESASCSQFSEEGKCRSSHLHHYGNHCKRSCGLCELVGSENPECDFPLTSRGDWLLFERGRREEVTIRSGQMTFSRLGTFICKAKHWSRDMYKFLSVYDNGCRPRYTCIEFMHNQEDNLLQFRISGSSEVDRSFHSCQFAPDLPPLYDRVRSEKMKILFPVSLSTPSSCGLGGLVHLQSTFSDGQKCQGSLSDWNPFTCGFTSKLALAFHGCRDGKTRAPREFTCEAYIQMPDNFRLLFTREENRADEDVTYQCWLISMSGNHSSYHAVMTSSYWQQASVLDRAACVTNFDLRSLIYQPSQVSLQIRTEPAERRCLEISRGSSAHVATTRYNVRDSDDDVRMRKKPQQEYIKQRSAACRAQYYLPLLLHVWMTVIYICS